MCSFSFSCSKVLHNRILFVNFSEMLVRKCFALFRNLFSLGIEESEQLLQQEALSAPQWLITRHRETYSCSLSATFKNWQNSLAWLQWQCEDLGRTGFLDILRIAGEAETQICGWNCSWFRHQSMGCGLGCGWGRASLALVLGLVVSSSLWMKTCQGFVPSLVSSVQPPKTVILGDRHQLPKWRSTQVQGKSLDARMRYQSWWQTNRLDIAWWPEVVFPYHWEMGFYPSQLGFAGLFSKCVNLCSFVALDPRLEFRFRFIYAFRILFCHLRTKGTKVKSICQ